jgi:predicted CoA-binding protein
MKHQNIVILGASENPDRYSYKAFQMLKQSGYAVIPVSPKLKELEGSLVAGSLKEIKEPVDTLTMYVSPEKSSQMTEEILSLKPRRVIFNPGSENPELREKLQKDGVRVIEACTLVLLRTHQFEQA